MEKWPSIREAMDKSRSEHVICSEKLADENMKPCKLKRHHSGKQTPLWRLNQTLKTVIKVVNFIKALCAHQTLPLHTEVHWLKTGKVFVRFIEI